MEKQEMEYYAKQIVNSAYLIHKELGPGLLESVYQYCMMEELKLNGVKAEQEVSIPLYYRNKKLEKEFRIDILVQSEIIIEIKAVENLLPVHAAQLISYMKLSDKQLGFLINFNVTTFKEGIRRYVNNY
jgi:GxxExxY protein